MKPNRVDLLNLLDGVPQFEQGRIALYLNAQALQTGSPLTNFAALVRPLSQRTQWRDCGEGSGVILPPVKVSPRGPV